MPSLSLPLQLYPCGPQGEFYTTITIGTTNLQAIVDTGSGVLLAIQNVPHVTTYKKRPQVSTLTTTNIPLGLNCSLQCTNEKHSACFFPQESRCELQFGTGDVKYNPVLESVHMGSLQHPAFYIALADTEQNFPFPIACLWGISHYKYSTSSPLGSLCSSSGSSNQEVLINQATTTFQLFQHLGGGNCLVDTQTIRLAYSDKDKSVSFAVPIPPPSVPHVPMITSMLPFYAVTLSTVQVGSVRKQFNKPQIVILDSGTSSGGSLAPEVYDFLASTISQYTNGLSGLSINDSQVQAVHQDKLGLFPPIAFTWTNYTHVIEPSTYMIPETCGHPNLINAFSRGSDNISILGNVCFQNLGITFNLLHDRVYFEHLGGVPLIDDNYPSPANKVVTTTMTESVHLGESSVVPAPQIRVGIPRAVIQKMASIPVNINVFGAALTNNQCCLFNEATQSKKNIGSFTLENGAPDNDSVWSGRNIALLSLLVAALAVGLWALAKYVLLLKKQK